MFMFVFKCECACVCQWIYAHACVYVYVYRFVHACTTATVKLMYLIFNTTKRVVFIDAYRSGRRRDHEAKRLLSLAMNAAGNGAGGSGAAEVIAPL
jgi:hypothetical protein